MEEIEVKIIEVNKEKMIKKLLSLGAKKFFEGDILAISYDFEDNFLTNQKSFIRLRMKGDKAFLAYKKKISQDGAKIMEEIETEVKEFDVMHDILLKLNLNHASDHKKKRTTYKIGCVLFEFDEYEDIPCYMEIEAPSIEIIEEYIGKLEIDRDKVKSWTGKEVMDYYGKHVDFMRV